MSAARRLFVATLCVLVGGLVLSSASALAVGPEAPTIMSESVETVEATAATLQAEIDPGGAATTYRFEYGTGESYGQSTPESASIGEGETGHVVTTRITGLQPGTTYHYRVVASNVESPDGIAGADKTLTTNPAPGSEPTGTCPNEARRAEQPFGLTLPECRAYEMVSPVETTSQDATDSFVEVGARAAVSGEAVTYSSKGSFGEAPGSGFENQYLSRRESDGWSTQDVTLLEHPTKTEAFLPYGSMVFTPELTAGVTLTNTPLASGAPEAGGGRYLYSYDFGDGAVQYIGNGSEPMGASTDLSHVVFGQYGEVSEWVEGTVIPVSVTNSGVNMGAITGSAPELYGEAQGSTEEHDVWHAVSADGSRVYFTSPGRESESPRQLYVRVNAEAPQSLTSGEECTEAVKACTIEVSAPQRSTPDPHGPQSARFWAASASGSKVFFTSNAELTEDAYTGPEDNAANLYEYELAGDPDERGKLTDLTVDRSGEGATVQGVVQVSEEGQYVYFVADGALAEGAVAGQPNLYVIHEGGAPRFIATLAAADNFDWGHEATGARGPADNTAVVDPSGSSLAFVSERSLTGYDNEQAAPGECENQVNIDFHLHETGKCLEIYLYDAASGRLACASCDSSGARPVGPSNLPWWSQGTLNAAIAAYRSRALLEDGTLFFESSDPLVPRASDGRQNVYEYREGEVRAISNVAGGGESFFVDASANGENVFFGSANKLLPQDKGDNVVVWDARVGGGFPVASVAPPCDNADSCKPPVSPQPAAFGAPASATFSGLGNTTSAVPAVVRAKKKTVAELRAEKLAKALKRCKQDKGKSRRKRCEASVRDKDGTAKPKQAKKSTDRKGSN